MPWILVDVVIAVLALVVLLPLGLTLWRRVRVLGRTVGELSALAATLDTITPPGGHPRSSPAGHLAAPSAGA